MGTRTKNKHKKSNICATFMVDQVKYQCPRCGSLTITTGRIGNINNLKCRGIGCTRSLSRRHQVE